MTHISFGGWRNRASHALRVRGASAATAALLAAAACSTQDLLDVPDPDVATPGSLDSPAALPVVYAGAIGDFAVAYTGDTGEGSSSGLIIITGLLADEWYSSDTFNDRNNVDLRQTREDDAVLVALMRRAQRARALADFASEKFEVFAPADVRRSETQNLAGFMITLLGEAFCSGVPISRVDASGATIYGAPRTTAQMWDEAIAKFDSALAGAVGTSAAAVAQRNLASIGKGRALLNKGDFAAAASAVAAVPSNFSYLILHSENSGRENNAVWVFQRTGRRVSVPDREGINGLPFRTSGDPRVPVSLGSPAVGFDNQTPMWYQDKYPLRASPVPVATGAEARLIEAEAAMRAGDVVGFAAAILAARVSAGVAAPFEAAATEAERVDQLFQERAYALWLTSHRLGDLRRLIRQYGRGSESVFPTGPWHKGGLYGTDVNLIIPLIERNNPNFGGCLDRNA